MFRVPILVAAAWLIGCSGSPRLSPELPRSRPNESGAETGAETVETGELATVAEPGEQRLFLFEVQREGLPTSYLHGSAHVLEAKDAAPHPVVDEAFLRADALVVEVDIAQVEPALLQGLTLQLGILPEGDDLSDHVSNEVWEELKRALPEYGLALSGVRRMRPWLVSVTLAAVAIQREGFASEHGVDQGYLLRAHGEPSKEVIELETPDAQLRMLAGLPDDIQSLMLKDALAQAETSSMADMLAAWKVGDLERFAELVFAPLRANPGLAPMYEAVFFERNRQMAERLDVLLSQGRKLFVVVGAGHMVGSKGIPALLAQRGYRIRQLTAPVKEQVSRQPASHATGEAASASQVSTPGVSTSGVK